MGVKLKYEDIKSIINKEDKLISKEYNNNKELLEIQCGKCNLIYSNRPILINLSKSYKLKCRLLELIYID